MTNKLIGVGAIALTSVLLSTGAVAHVANGGLVDSSNSPVKSTYSKCVKVADGVAHDQCGNKPKPKPAPVVAAPKPAPAPVVAPAPKKPEVVSRTATLAGDALFATNSSRLSAAGQSALDDFVAKAAAINLTNVDVIGHADSRGAAAYNLGLSVKRANTVKNYLASKGINSSIINASGRGEDDPIASNNTAEGRAQNRRVEINVTGTSK